jgi:hypothetical protein
VALADEDARVMDGLGETGLKDDGLEAALEEVVDLQREDVVEGGLALAEHAHANAAAEDGVTLEDTLGVLLVESEELTSSRTEAREDERDPPDLALVPQTVLADHLELLIKTLLLKRATRATEGDVVCSVSRAKERDVNPHSYDSSCPFGQWKGGVG